MFYQTDKNDHGLPHDPFKAIVAPRPIGWITSMSAKGEINLAPYSYFNGVSSRPPMVMFSSEGFKDSVANVAETKEFVCSLATWDLREEMNKTSATLPHGVNEMEVAGLKAAPATLCARERAQYGIDRRRSRRRACRHARGHHAAEVGGRRRRDRARRQARPARGDRRASRRFDPDHSDRDR